MFVVHMKISMKYTSISFKKQKKLKPTYLVHFTSFARRPVMYSTMLAAVKGFQLYTIFVAAETLHTISYYTYDV